MLGALPILSGALYIWFREHRPGPRVLPAVVLAAQATDLCRGGSFNLQDGLDGFLAAYAEAYAVDQAFSVDLVYNALAKAVSESMSDPMTLKCVISDPRTGDITTTWAAFETRLSTAYLARDAGADLSGGPVFTRDELDALVHQLTQFRRAQAATIDRRAAMANSTGAGGGGVGGPTARMIQSGPRDFGAELAASDA